MAQDERHRTKMKIIKGTSVSKGIAFGYLDIRSTLAPDAQKTNIQDTDREVKRFFKASADAFNHLQTLYEKTLSTAGEDHAQIFSIQQMMLQDGSYVNSIVKIITEEKVCAEYAVKRVAATFQEKFLDMEDEMIRSKSYDIKDISSHIIYFLGNDKKLPKAKDATDTIIVSDSFVPSSIVDLNLSSASAAIAASGLKKSHFAILARKFEIPTIINAGVFDRSLDGKFAAVNGFTGEIIVEPDDKTIAVLKKRQSRYDTIKSIMHKIFKNSSETDKKPQIKLIAVDLDGTIISNATEFSNKTIEALNTAAEQGIIVAVCTGRVYGEIPEAIRNIEGVRYFITSNGSSIITNTGNIIYSNTIEKNIASDSLDILSEYDVMIDLYINGNGYMQSSDIEKLEHYNVTDGFDKVLKVSRIMKDDIMRFYREELPALEKINLFFADKQERKEAIYRIGRLEPSPKIVYSMEHNLEITSSTCSKGQGLNFLSNLLEVHMSEVMAIGDSNNDVSMLKLAGLSVAMGNSPKYVKDTVDYVTDTCENDGAAKAIKKYALR